jgi:hypothetical protein
MGKNPDPGSGRNILDNVAESFGISFRLKILKFLVKSVLRIRIRDGKI